jgi:Tfp pilus assembly protein PilO
VFSRREKILLIATAAVVAAIVALQFAGTSGSSPGADEARISARWRALKKQVGTLEARLASTTSTPSKAVPRLLRAAQASAAATGITLASIRPRRPTRTASGSMEHSVEIQAAGRFPDVARFMLDIEHRQPYVRLARVAITSTDGASDKVNATFMIAGYSPGEVRK